MKENIQDIYMALDIQHFQLAVVVVLFMKTSL